jgi:hypothetical protein
MAALRPRREPTPEPHPGERRAGAAKPSNRSPTGFDGDPENSMIILSYQKLAAPAQILD